MKDKTRKLIISIVAALLALLIIVPMLATIFSAFAVSQAEIDALEEERDGIIAEQENLAQQIADLQSEQASVIEQKQKLDEQNELTRQEIEVINEQIDLYTGLIANKELELAAAEEDVQAQYERLRTRMRAMEENGTLSYITILFKATSFSDLLARIDYISEIMSYDKGLEEDYIAAKNHVAEVKAEFEEIKAEEEAACAELEAKKAQLEADIEAACQVIAALEEDIVAYEAYYAEMEAQQASMDAQITKMLEELAAQEAAAAAAAAGGGSPVGTGSLTWPLPGYSAGSRTFGYQLHPILNVMKYHSGQDIGAPSGTPIIASDSGTVVTASTGYNGGYGNYVMINHGNGLVTLYAHMSSVAVSSGQTVSKGQTIGYVGSTGLSTGPHLHFEVRVNGSAVDPMSYF